VHSCNVFSGLDVLTLPAGTGARMVWPRKDLDMTVCMVVNVCTKSGDLWVQMGMSG